MTNPTERPEERDSLAEIESRLANRYRGDGETAYHINAPHLLDDLRTLINEVKQRDRKNAELERLLRRALEREGQDHVSAQGLVEDSEKLIARIKQMEGALRE